MTILCTCIGDAYSTLFHVSILSRGHPPAACHRANLTTMKRRQPSPWLVSCVSLLGCGEGLPAIEYETEHLHIGTDFEHPLCAGDLVALERIVLRVEDELEVQMPKPTKVYVWDDLGWEAEGHRHCPSGAGGCFKPSSQTIYASEMSLDHELVHATLGTTDLPPFIEESIAAIYSGDQSRFGIATYPSDNTSNDSDAVNLGTGRHFVRWLREQWGVSKLARLVHTRPAEAFDFAPIYGVSLETIENHYLAEAPYAYSSLDHCSAPALEPGAFGPLLLTAFDLSCTADVDTYGTEFGVHTVRRFEISSSGYHTVQVDGDWFDIYRCSPERIDEYFENDGYLQDVPAYHTGYPSGASRFYEGGTPHTLYFEAGTHVITLGREGHADTTIRLALWPSYGPRPDRGH